MGFIAMKALSGGLIQNSCRLCLYSPASVRQCSSDLGYPERIRAGQFLSYQDCPPELDTELAAQIEKDKKNWPETFAVAAVTACRALPGSRSTTAPG